MRIYAIYHENKSVLRLMLASFLVCSTTSAIIMGMSLRGIRGATAFSVKIWMFTKVPTTLATPVDVPDGKFCDGLGMLPHFYAFWIPFLLFDTLLCILALIHGYRDYKEGDRNIAALKYFNQQRLSEILVRDSIIYFVA